MLTIFIRDSLGFYLLFLLFYRATPFANGASDNPDGILKRIGEGNLKMDSGNWLSVSSEAKVNR